MVKSINFNHSAVSSDKYKQTLTEMIRNFPFTTGDKEEPVRKGFEEVVKEGLKQSGIYDEENAFGLIDMFKSETKIKDKNRNIRFIDSDFKNIVIEYKRYERLDKEKDKQEAIQQLEDYMLSPDLEKFPILYGFLTDGKSFYSYKKEGSSFENIKEFSGNINEYVLDYFIRCLINYDKKDITPCSLKNDFAIIDNKYNDTTKKLFLELLQIKNNSTSNRTKLLFSEWEKLFKLSESDKGKNEEVTKRRIALSKLTGKDIRDTSDEYNVIFALHTVYSLIIKLIAIKAAKENSVTYNTNFFELSKLQNNDLNRFISSVENGNVFKKMNVMNMIEGDFFSWYIGEQLTDVFYDNFRDLCFKLSKYENFTIKKLYKTQDFFRQLYESCVPAEIRHSFGEFYTPYWLADGVVSDYIERNNITDIYKSLDPTCGSGTFIMVNMDKQIGFINKNHKDLTNKEKTNIILSNCFGIDLNPLAVLSSKINYFMNIASVYDGTYEIEIPIYLGDSSYMPQFKDVDGVKCITYDFFTDVDDSKDFIHFCLPVSLVNDKNFISYMDKLEGRIVGKESDEKKISNSFNYIISKIDETSLNDKVKDEIMSLIKELVWLESKDLNSIWLRIFANYLKSAVFENIDLIAGNPPWVDWKNLPEKYRDKLTLSCRDTGIFSDDTNTGGNSLNICALIAIKCCNKYLSDDGELSFLMPDGILYNKSFEGFRRFKIGDTKYYFQKITDWSKAGVPFDPVKVNFCCYTVSKQKQNYANGIPFIRYTSKKGIKLNDTHAVFETEQNKLNIERKYAYMVDMSKNNPFTVMTDAIPNIDKIVGTKYARGNRYVLRKGLGLKAEVHKLLYAHECEFDNSLAYFYTHEKVGKLKYPTNNKVLLEKKYIRPLIESPSLSPYKLNWDGLYTVFPYEWGNKNPISFDDFEKIAPYMAKYLFENKEILEEQSSFNARVQNVEGFFGILRTGDYMFADNFVCTRDNTEFFATPVQKVETHWGEMITPVFDGHISYISVRDKAKNDFISEDEMLFITALLNSPFIKEFINNSSTGTSISTKFDVKLPIYDANNEKHKKIVFLIKELIKEKESSSIDEDKINDIISQIQNIYIELEH